MSGPSKNFEKVKTAEATIGGFSAIGAVDSDTTVTTHRTNNTTVTSESYVTVFDINAETLLLGGSIYSGQADYRLTIDGTVVYSGTDSAAGIDTGGSDAFSVAVIPKAYAQSSMKLEAYNPDATTSDRGFGWRVQTA